MLILSFVFFCIPGEGDLESRHINFFGDDAEMMSSSVGTTSSSVTVTRPGAREPVTEAGTDDGTDGGDSIVLSSYVSERVFGLTGSMQLIFDLTSLPPLNFATQPPPAEITSSRLIPSTSESVAAGSMNDAPPQSTLPPRFEDGSNTDSPAAGVFTDRDVFPVVLVLAILFTLALTAVIFVICLRGYRRRRVTRKVYSRHIVNSTVASKERERRRQRQVRYKPSVWGRSKRRRSGEFRKSKLWTHL